MTTIIKKVVLAGATGNLGEPILEQILKAGFEVTVLTRPTSNHTFPSNVKVVAVDYDNFDNLVAALRGQDALISTLGSAAFNKQLLLVKAAAEAGVKRFIPSEFGSDTLNEKSRALPVFKDKIIVQDALKKEAAAGNLSYSIIVNGPFLDWGIKIGWLINLKGKSIVLHDGGDRPFSTTSVTTIGKAVVGVLKRPDDTKNRVLYIQEASITLKQLASLGKKATGSDGWKESEVLVSDEIDEGWAELKKENPNPQVFAMKFISASIWGEGYGTPFPKLDNELLGIKELSEDQIQDLVNSFV